jgi:exonuclease SbcC
MLLPQGQFAKFLQAADDDRRVLLSRLFGTQLYDRITAELDRRRAAAVRQRAEAGEAIRTAVSAAAEAAGLDAPGRAALLALPRADCDTQLKQFAADLALEASVSTEGLEIADGQVEAARDASEQAQRQATAMTRLTQAQQLLSEHQGTQAAHEQRVARLAAARHAEPVRPLLVAADEAQQAVSDARAALLRLVPDPGPALLAGTGGPQAFVRAEAADRDAAGLRHLAGEELTLPERLTTLRQLQQAAAESAARVTALERARQDLPGQIDALDRQLAGAQQVAAGLSAARERHADLERRRAAASQLAGLKPRLDQLDEAVRAAVDIHQQLVDAHQQAMESRLNGMAAELAATLSDGAPCPVCGSPGHPAPARAAAGAVTQQAVGQARARRDAAEQDRARLTDQRDTLAREAAAARAVAAGGTPAGLAAEAGVLTGELARCERAVAEAAVTQAELGKRRDEQQRVEREQLAAAAQAAARREQAAQAESTLGQLQEQVASAAQGHQSVSARQAALSRAAQADRALGRTLDQLEAALAAAARAQDRASAEAAARGFREPGEASAALLTEAGQAALDDQVAAWTARLSGLQSAVSAADLAGLDPQRAEEVHAAARGAGQALARAQEAEHEVRAARDATQGKLARLQQRLGDVQDAQEASDQLQEDTSAVIRLAGLAKGMDGHRRMALTTYVLRQWFGQVVAAANIRLGAMSAGRYELRRTDEGGARRERTGLTLAVIDRHTGAERSPRSLSGGETFYTSLALALGLADVVKAEAGGVDLDTLFIDEGFGTLDAETLDQVMAVIDELRDRGRAVGIVSHVADLKDRVAERLEVRRLADGSSTARVIA